MKRKIKLWAIGLLFLFGSPALGEAFTRINPETPAWQMAICYILLFVGAITLKRATD